jgi:hypothetical protein
MGASRWDHFTPFRDDPAEALAELQQKVFEAGLFVRPEVVPDDFTFESIEDLRMAAMEEGTHSILDIHAVAAKPLHLQSGQAGDGGDNAEDLDPELEAKAMEYVLATMFDAKTADKIRAKLGEPREPAPSVSTIEYGEVAVVGDDLLVQLFSTATPDKETVLDQAHQLYELSSVRWTAVCVPVYADGVPSEYYFVGVSGD